LFRDFFHGLPGCGKTPQSAIGSLEGARLQAAPYIVFKESRAPSNFQCREFFRKLLRRGLHSSPFLG
jgi:hypothetical protein